MNTCLCIERFVLPNLLEMYDVGINPKRLSIDTNTLHINITRYIYPTNKNIFNFYTKIKNRSKI